jgi:cyclase
MRELGRSLLLAACSASTTTAFAELRTTHVAGNIWMISGAGGNVAVSAGTNGVLVVDSGAAGMTEELLTSIREISTDTIRYVINTSVLPEHTGGNALIRAAGDTFTGGNATVVGGVDEGAAVVTYEATLLRMASTPGVDVAAWPTETFYVPKIDLYFNGEPVLLMHQPAAVDDTNLIVHFRRSDVISTGDVFRLDRYPWIDLDHGGSIQGVIGSLNGLIDLAVSDTLAEGGTLIVPGHGRICDEGDLVRYRDMLTIIRDRVAALIERGHDLEGIVNARPSLDYDSRYGRDPTWGTQDFLAAVYASLTR